MERAQGATFQRRRRECRMPSAPAAARVVVDSTRVSHHRFTGRVRHSLRDGFTAYSGLSLVTGLVCHHPRAMRSIVTKLNASVGASGPHGFAVRSRRFVRRADARLTPPASTASHPNDRDDHDAPLSRGGTAGIEGDLPRVNSGIFCGGELDWPNHVEFARKNRVFAQRLALPIAPNWGAAINIRRQ